MNQNNKSLIGGQYEKNTIEGTCRTFIGQGVGRRGVDRGALVLRVVQFTWPTIIVHTASVAIVLVSVTRVQVVLYTNANGGGEIAARVAVLGVGTVSSGGARHREVAPAKSLIKSSFQYIEHVWSETDRSSNLIQNLICD